MSRMEKNVFRTGGLAVFPAFEMLEKLYFPVQYCIFVVFSSYPLSGSVMYAEDG